MIQGLTAVQNRMYEVLADGLIHSKAELFACLDDPDGNVSTIFAHISTMRPVLNRRGEHVEMIPPVKGRKTGYRLVRLLASAVDGKR